MKTSAKVVCAIEVYRAVEKNEKDRQKKKQRCLDKLDSLRAMETEQQTAIEVAENEAVEASGKCALDDNAPTTDLEAALVRKSKASAALEGTRLMIVALDKELKKLEIDPIKPHPVMAARAAFFEAVFEDARARLLSSELLPILHRAYISQQLFSGFAVQGDDEVNWNSFIKVLVLPAPSRTERVRIAGEIEDMIRPATLEANNS